MKKGLILEGGAMRGIFTAGIIDVFLENGIAFDGIVGVSAGAIFGSNYKSNQPGRSLRYNLKYSRDKRFCGLYSLVFTGDLFGAEFCYHELPEHLDIFDKEAFASSPVEFYVVTTDADTGKPIYQKILDGGYDDLEWIRASASMPLVSRVVEVGGHRMLDGGISDSIPLRFFESKGYDKNVIILTRPRDYIKKPSRIILLMRAMMKKYPKVAEAMAKRHDDYNRSLADVRISEAEGRALVICPDEALPIGRIEKDPEKIRAVYEIGRQQGLKYLDRVRAFLSQGS